MEWSIPLQKLEVGKVQIGEIQHNEKSLVPLAYFDGQNNFSNLNIFLPKLKVEEFDENSGKLVISLSDNKTCDAKLNALQSTLLGAVFIQQRIWFPDTFYIHESLNNSFKPIVSNGLLNFNFKVFGCGVRPQPKARSRHRSSVDAPYRLIFIIISFGVC